MKIAPQPLFEVLTRFKKLEFQSPELRYELPEVRAFLEGFPAAFRAKEGYVAVRAFLKTCSDNETTFNSYRTHAERLLLWSLLEAQKPLLELNHSDSESFVAFCLKPPSSWVGPVVRDRFTRIGSRMAHESDSYMVNADWRPFNWHNPKSDRSTSSGCTPPPLSGPPLGLSQATLNKCISVCKCLFVYAVGEDLTEVNPFDSNRLPSRGRRIPGSNGARSLSKDQWLYVIDTAAGMASEDVRHERTLFILATVYAMYLNVSDLSGKGRDALAMKDFRRDAAGLWWLYLRKGARLVDRVRAPQQYLDVYLARYRRILNLPPLPSDDEAVPLLCTLGGRPGLSDHHIRGLLQPVFDLALVRMRQDGWSEMEVDQLRSASLQWIRNTSARLASPNLNTFELQAALRIRDIARYTATVPGEESDS
ncbi:site-specific integrase [Pseudomonas sediminis]|uniref:site-specific integrase n=1 Tax=Pseudomonas sediminis TaxID=1691904 RepID=UPI0031CC512B